MHIAPKYAFGMYSAVSLTPVSQDSLPPIVYNWVDFTNFFSAEMHIFLFQKSLPFGNNPVRAVVKL